MRNNPPPLFVRCRYLLLVSAVIALAVAAAVLFLFKGDASFPTEIVVPFAAVTFIWTNGAFWWLELRYPHIEQAKGVYVSRVDRGSRCAHVYSDFFFWIYSIAAVLITLGCIRLAAGG